MPLLDSHIKRPEDVFEVLAAASSRTTTDSFDAFADADAAYARAYRGVVARAAATLPRDRLGVELLMHHPLLRERVEELRIRIESGDTGELVSADDFKRQV